MTERMTFKIGEWSPDAIDAFERIMFSLRMQALERQLKTGDEWTEERFQSDPED